MANHPDLMPRLVVVFSHISTSRLLCEEIAPNCSFVFTTTTTLLLLLLLLLLYYYYYYYYYYY